MDSRAKGKYQKWLEPENLIRLEGWARDGLTDEMIATKMGITRKTLAEWKKKYGNICDTLKRGKEVVDIQVENALLKRALGYQYEEVSEKYEMGILTERKVTKKEVIPDTTAQIYWLKNRKPEVWRDKREQSGKEEYENDGFIEALRNQASETFREAGDIVETEVKDEDV